VRNTKSVLSHRIQSRLKTSLPKLLTLVGGALLVLFGLINSVDILILRGNQHSLVNNLLLVFTGTFLVFLALHEGHVARAQTGVHLS
jgi:hypothetical protein